MCNRRKAGEESDGFILVAVLGVLALLAGLFVALSLSLRTGVDTATLASEELAADALIQAGTEIAGYQLFALRRPPDAVDGQEIRLDGGVVSLGVGSEAGKVDLNGSDIALLAAAYRSAGLGRLTPDSFAARVADWRDEDGQESGGGAEAPAYAAAGLGFGPRDGPFHSVDDLKWVLGVGLTDIDALRPFLTTYNPKGLLDVFVAPAELIGQLPGLDQASLAAVLSARQVPGEPGIARLRSLLDEQAAYLNYETTPVFSVSVSARSRRSVLRRSSRMVLVPAANGPLPYWIVSERSLSGAD